ncbi:MAG: hypothetical protein INF79_18980 [Roseomonas sp.]|nr:hypothetical protein [Roseomonas sp.]
MPDFVFLDLDRCLNPLHPDAARLLEACPTYAEITPSGNGARIIGRASEISATISRKGTTAGGMAVEIYRAALSDSYRRAHARPPGRPGRYWR